MREAVYLILTFAMVDPAFGFESSPTPSVNIVQHHAMPPRLDLQTPVFMTVVAERAPSAVHGPRTYCAAVCASASLAAPPRALGETWGHTIPQLAGAARGAIAWALPAGLSVLAAATLGQTTLIGQPTSPLGATVPTMKALATIALDLNGIAGSPLRVDLSVSRNWQLDAPIGGTYPDCALRLDVAAGAAPKLSFQAPCGTVGHFGIGIRGRF